jgi:hypothetical protein
MQDTSIVPTLSVANAKLPVVYDKAKAALARLDRVNKPRSESCPMNKKQRTTGGHNYERT